MKKNVVVKNGELRMTKKFHEQACIYGTKEYKLLRRIQRENPDCDIVYTSAGKKTYKRLTFEAMEKYIRNRTDNNAEHLKAFEEAKKATNAKNNAYPATKKWFLDTYPEYKESSLTKTEVKEIREKAKGNPVIIPFPGVAAAAGQ